MGAETSSEEFVKKDIAGVPPFESPPWINQPHDQVFFTVVVDIPDLIVRDVSGDLPSPPIRNQTALLPDQIVNLPFVERSNSCNKVEEPSFLGMMTSSSPSPSKSLLRIRAGI